MTEIIQNQTKGVSHEPLCTDRRKMLPMRFSRKERKERKTKMNRMMTVGAIVAVMTSALAGIAPKEMEMRVPRGCYLSAAVDVDAIRAETPTLIGFVREAIANGGTNGMIHTEKTNTALKPIDRAAAWLAEIKRECGVEPEDFHWAMFAARNHHFWMQRDNLQTQFVWGAVISAERLDWKRVEQYSSAKGLRWVSEPLFGGVSHRVSWFGDSGYLAGMLSFSVADDGMVYLGTGVNMGWVYANEGKWKAMLDERPSRCGKLEKGEVVRVVVTDLKAIPLLGRGAMDVRPYGPALAGIDECRISLFLLNGKIGARLQVDFFDEAKANAAKALYEAEKPLASTRSVMEENLARAKAQGNQGDIARTEMALGWMDGLKVDFKGKTLLVDTGLIDARQFFTVMAEPLAGTLEMF